MFCMNNTPAPLSGKVFITGGAGFLGRGIIRRAYDDGWPCDITIYSRDEEKQFRIRQRWPDVQCILGDIGDKELLYASMAGHDTIIHAAAVKDVPIAELNPEQAITVNAVGSRNVLWAANMIGARTCIGISTDKACLPVNIYGATKLVMERLFAGYRHPGRTRSLCVRYGNVVGSTGSIIPIFKEQLRTRGRVSVTDPQMTRFWLSINEAIDLILMAACSGSHGGVFVKKCASMKIGDLAEMIAGNNIDIIGRRPGEKQHETLIHYQESVLAEELPRDGIVILHPQIQPPPTEGKEAWTYQSGNPTHWLSPDTMQMMIANVEGL